MDKKELREILDLVKEKLEREVGSACGLFWADNPPCDPNMDYAVGECPCVTEYAVGECDDPVDRYGVGE